QTFDNASEKPVRPIIRSSPFFVPDTAGHSSDKFWSTQVQKHTRCPTTSISEIPSSSARDITSRLLGKACSILIQSPAIDATVYYGRKKTPRLGRLRQERQH